MESAGRSLVPPLGLQRLFTYRCEATTVKTKDKRIVRYKERSCPPCPPYILESSHHHPKFIPSNTMNGFKHASSSSSLEDSLDDNQPIGQGPSETRENPVGISAQGYAKGASSLIKLVTDLRANGFVFQCLLVD